MKFHFMRAMHLLEAFLVLREQHESEDPARSWPASEEAEAVPSGIEDTEKTTKGSLNRCRTCTLVVKAKYSTGALGLKFILGI